MSYMSYIWVKCTKEFENSVQSVMILYISTIRNSWHNLLEGEWRNKTLRTLKSIWFLLHFVVKMFWPFLCYSCNTDFMVFTEASPIPEGLFYAHLPNYILLAGNPQFPNKFLKSKFYIIALCWRVLKNC